MDNRENREKVALFPASFDPLTNGHLDVVERALGIFDRLVLAVAFNIEKKDTFTKDERLAMLRSVFGDEPRIDVTAFDCLTVDFAKEIGAQVIIRGLRAISDFEYELQLALTNRTLEPDIETVFLLPGKEYIYLASRIVKEIASYGGPVDEFVTPAVEKRLRGKYGTFPEDR